MSRTLAMVAMLALALGGCGVSSVGNNEVADDGADDGPKLDKPMAPGAGFTDLPPLEPPVDQPATPERQSEPSF